MSLKKGAELSTRSEHGRQGVLSVTLLYLPCYSVLLRLPGVCVATVALRSFFSLTLPAQKSEAEVKERRRKLCVFIM